jgi:hypothetical protein
VNSTISTIIAFIGSTGILGIAGRYALSALNSGITDLQANISKHLTPNGGSSAYDQITQAKDLAQQALDATQATQDSLKTLEISTQEALKDLSEKVDNLISSRLS